MEERDEIPDSSETTREAIAEKRQNMIAELERQRSAVDAEKRELLQKQLTLMIQQLTRAHENHTKNFDFRCHTHQ